MGKLNFIFLAFALIACDCEGQSVLTFLTPSGSQPQYANVYIEFGQSNDEGAASTIGMNSAYVGPHNVYIYSTNGSGSNVRTKANQTWQKIQAGLNNNSSGVAGVATPNYGPEMAFAKEMGEDHPNNVFILKFSVSGATRLGEGGTNDWKLGGGGTNYTNLVSNTVLNGLLEISEDFPALTMRIKGLSFHQGEAERDGVAGLDATQLQAAMKREGTRLIQSIIDDLVEHSYDVKDLRICWGRIHNGYNSVPFPTMLAAVRAADVDIATNILTDQPGYAKHIAGSTYLDTDAYDHVDNHFSQTGYITFGTDRYNYFIPFYNDSRTISYASTSGFDTDAALFVTTAKLTSQTQANAVNTLVLSLKANSLWTKSLAIYLFVGGTRESHKLNLKDPTNALGYSLTFNSGFNHAPQGFFGDGVLGYADTHIPVSVLGQNTAGAFFYSGTSGQEAKYFFGTINAAATSRFYWGPRWTDNLNYVAVNGSELTGDTNTDGSGFFLMTRTSSSAVSTYIRGTKKTFSSTSVAGGSETISIGARTGTTVGSFSTRIAQAFGFFNASLNDTDESNLRSAINAFETSVR